MSTSSPPLADHAAEYLLAFSEQRDRSRSIANLLFESANQIATEAGAEDFIDLAICRMSQEKSAAIIISRGVYSDALAAGMPNVVGAAASVHLMALHLMGQLESSPEAKQIAALGLGLYVQENAYRIWSLAQMLEKNTNAPNR